MTIAYVTLAIALLSIVISGCQIYWVRRLGRALKVRSQPTNVYNIATGDALDTAEAVRRAQRMDTLLHYGR